jgi:hypothetical protein
VVNSTIKIGENTVTKTSDPKRMSVEVEKTLRARTIGKNCGLFYVPEVLEYNNSKGLAVFERIHHISPIINVLKSTKQCSPIVKQVGSALAVIHRELTLPDEMIIELPLEFRSHGTEVFIHGDFNPINVCISLDTPSIIILDWQMTGQHGGEATYGTRYFDLIWFVNYLLWSPTFKFFFPDQVNKITKLFFQSYFKESGLFYDVEMFVRYSNNFFETKLPDRKKTTSRAERYLLPYSKELTKRFIKSLNSHQSCEG